MIAKVHSDTPKKDDTQTQDTQNQTQSVNLEARSQLDRNTSYGAYGAGNNKPNADLTSSAWEKSKDAPWAGSPQGRLAIRTVSRGLFGAAAFAAGGLLGERLIRGEVWKAGEKITEHAYNSNASFFEQKNPIQFLAKSIDTFVGKPIQWAVKTVTGSEQAGLRAVRFRPTKYVDKVTQQMGRSLGEETVGVTFDFFCASVGDAFGRDLINMVDPNTKKPWNDKDGHFSLTDAGKNAAKTAFRYVTYNGGEDWAVAIPYVYFMKGQRALINHFSPGFKYDFDRSLNGGSFKVDNNNKVVGSYGLEGLIDLQSRFTVYNVGTLMYREAYNHVAAKLENKPTALYGAPDDPANANKGVLDKIADVGKWALRSAVKGTMYMTPAVPFFWATRSAQLKHQGVFVNQEQGILSHIPNGRPNTLRAHELKIDSPIEQVYYANHTNEGWRPVGAKNTFANPLNHEFKPYDQGGTLIDRGFDCIGKVNKKINNKITGMGDRLDDLLESHPHFDPRDKLGINFSAQYLPRFANAAVAYTPYMYAKAEMANLWDDGKMDASAERMINGATSFNWGEFKSGVGEVWNSMWKKPLSDPDREQEAQRRIDLDRSAPADFRKAHGERAARLNEKQAKEARDAALKASGEGTGLSWQDRIVAVKGGKTEVSPQFDSRPRTHAESEAMKKALAELDPPTNAIN